MINESLLMFANMESNTLFYIGFPLVCIAVIFMIGWMTREKEF